MSVIDELERLQKEIDNAKKNAAILEGRLQEAIKRLKEDFGLDSVEEATKEVGKLKNTIEELKVDIETKFFSLKDKYAW